MLSVRPVCLMFLSRDVFDGHGQQQDAVSVPLTPHAGDGLDPLSLPVVHGMSAFERACKAVWGRAEWAIVMLVPGGPAPDADGSAFPEVDKLDNLPHGPHVVVILLHEGGAVD